MNSPIILASASRIRADLLRNAGVNFRAVPARIDEEELRHALEAEGAGARDLADALAEAKARKISGKFPDSLVIGCDQVLAFRGETVAKSETKEEAIALLKRLRGQAHQLLSAAVVYHQGEAQWRHVGVVRMHMRDFSDEYLHDYIERNWNSIREAVGCYKLEEEGVRLFREVNGDYFSVLGLPLLPLLDFLAVRGVIES